MRPVGGKWMAPGHTITAVIMTMEWEWLGPRHQEKLEAQDHKGIPRCWLQREVPKVGSRHQGRQVCKSPHFMGKWEEGRVVWIHNRGRDQESEVSGAGPGSPNQDQNPGPKRESVKKKSKANLISGTKKLRLELQHKESGWDRNGTG